uniref:Protein YIPF n=1 Tax=Syphacia muris TaxID=451379 RepID=A0A0N5AWC3_9BILA
MFIPYFISYIFVLGVIEDYDNEPPLLEELGINFSHIWEKTLAVLNPVGSVVIADQDLAGPLVFCLLFGASLLLHGKLSFGYIYGIGGLSCVGMYALLNIMAAEKSISFTCTASVLGYCLLPMALLSMLAAVLSLQGAIGGILSAAAVLWCSVSSSKLFVTTLAVDRQRLLIAYPCTLLYSVFALLAIF